MPARASARRSGAALPPHRRPALRAAPSRRADRDDPATTPGSARGRPLPGAPPAARAQALPPARPPASQRQELLRSTGERLQPPVRRTRAVVDRRTLLGTPRWCGRRLIHRRISLPGPAKSVEKIGGHAATSVVKIDGNTPTFTATSLPPSPYHPQNPDESSPGTHQTP